MDIMTIYTESLDGIENKAIVPRALCFLFAPIRSTKWIIRSTFTSLINPVAQKSSLSR